MGRIEATLAHLGSLDELARRDSSATRLDPRVKLVATLAFVAVVASFGRLELARLAPLALYPLALAALGDVPWRPLLLRLALAAPFALGVAAFEPFLDRAPAVTLGTLAISGGLVAFATILAKFALTLGAGLLLVATTGFDEVCVALRRLALPRAVVAQLMLTYRYLFVLAEEAARLVRARALRAPEGRRLSLSGAGTLLGQLLLRALARAERIHVAMRCRGFDGRLPVRRAWRLGPGDAAFAAATLLLLLAARAADLPALVGGAITGALR
ncbi:MAG TPA: cobalt ECF transporter T component CbiQ [Anaeromyxobacter sp.]|nr:cobalt ECF transporter T component CbiQ [Anaeromyxobacter sp.]